MSAGKQTQTAYWSQPVESLFQMLESTPQGLSSEQASQRLKASGLNILQKRPTWPAARLLIGQFKNPLVLILIFAVCVSAIAGEWIDAVVIIAVVIGTAVLGFLQEYNATTAVEKLLERVEIKTRVLRNAQPKQVPTDEIVPGDVVVLSAGNLIPADGIVLEANDCYVDQAALTGEAFPVEKKPGVLDEATSLAERTNCVFMGTSVRSGTVTVLMVNTGATTAYGQIAQRLALRPPETEFERGIRHFGYFLIQIILLLVLFVFAINVFAQKPPIDSLLFAIALAVGVAPELLPAIVTITLAKGAQQMAAGGVIVRRLNAIENFGNMDILCTDKTGTLTEGVIELNGAFDIHGRASPNVHFYAFLNSHFQVGMANSLDDAIVRASSNLEPQVSSYQKIDEIPYDFVRRRLSVILEDSSGQRLMITKGALNKILDGCKQAANGEHAIDLDDKLLAEIDQRQTVWSRQGYRVLGLAAKPLESKESYTSVDETGLIFYGFLLFFDPPKSGVRDTLADLALMGVELKIITGDNRHVAEHLAAQVGLSKLGILSGEQLDRLPDEALRQIVERTNLFVEVDPNQKERVILTLKKMGHVVGYIGDGINDAPALHVADVGISVDGAVDVAKEAADFVLLAHNLTILRDGIVYGRKTFANTLKYVFTTTSANFGNMFSMAGLSLFLPFLPMLAKQILLNNFLSDFPGMAIATDTVDREWIDKPHRWDVKQIRKFMIVFGLVSSVFDYLTFAVLLWVVQASPDQFRTGWFIESLMTELVIALVVRTRRPFFRSKPGRWLWLSTLIVALFTLLLPYLPINSLFEFTPLPLPTMALLLIITGGYVAATEFVKKWFYRETYVVNNA